MKILWKVVALSTATLTLAIGAMPASAKTKHHSKRAMRHHSMSSAKGMHTMSKGSMMNKGTMKNGTPAATDGMANPAMSTAPATSGGDKP